MSRWQPLRPVKESCQRHYIDATRPVRNPERAPAALLACVVGDRAIGAARSWCSPCPPVRAGFCGFQRRTPARPLISPRSIAPQSGPEHPSGICARRLPLARPPRRTSPGRVAPTVRPRPGPIDRGDRCDTRRPLTPATPAGRAGHPPTARPGTVGTGVSDRVHRMPDYFQRQKIQKAVAGWEKISARWRACCCRRPAGSPGGALCHEKLPRSLPHLFFPLWLFRPWRRRAGNMPKWRSMDTCE